MTTDLRGQTEPLAALVAVTMFAFALGMFGMYSMDVLESESADTEIEEATIDQIWADINTERAFDPTTELEETVDIGSIPQGQTVYVSVTRASDDGIETVDEALFFQNGTATSPSPVEDIPDEAGTVTRPIPIYATDNGDRQHGDIRGASLEVSVWDL